VRARAREYFLYIDIESSNFWNLNSINIIYFSLKKFICSFKMLNLFLFISLKIKKEN